MLMSYYVQVCWVVHVVTRGQRSDTWWNVPNREPTFTLHSTEMAKIQHKGNEIYNQENCQERRRKKQTGEAGEITKISDELAVRKKNTN